MTVNSPDISNLFVEVTWDLSNSTPQIELVNKSQGNNLANVVYAFVIKSPSQTIMWDGNIAQPDISGVWEEFTFFSVNPDPTLSPPPTNYLVAPWPRPFNQIEWSAAPYTIEVIAKDSVGNIFSYTLGQSICRPAGNINTSITTYGLGAANITMNCNAANAFFEDITNTSYKGLSGTQESSILKVLYPSDETSTTPPPFIINDFSTALVQITYDSENYEYVYNGVYLYDFENGSFVRIKYYRKQRFPVLCNIDLCPLVCEVQKLIEKFESGDCQNEAQTQNKLIAINSKLNLAFIAKTQPLCGIDLPALIEEIKVLGGFYCNCCAPSGIAPFNSATIANYNFQIISGGGDISGTVGVTGNNIQFTLYDKSYVFKICPDAPTNAFTVTPNLQGYTKTYCLNVNMNTLATDLASTISNNIDLVNLWSAIGGGNVNTDFIVDGKCIFQSVPECDYLYTLENIPSGSSYALLTSFNVNGTILTPNFAFNTGNLASLQTWFNNLDKGTFSVEASVSGGVTIQTNSNANTFGDLGYSIYPNNYLASLSKVCGSYIPIDRNTVIQNIINYLCPFEDSKVVTSEDYAICYIDGSTNQKQTVTVSSGTELTTFISNLLERGCDTIDYVVSLKKLDCANILDVFQPSINLLNDNDIIIGTKGGFCASFNPVELGTRILQLGAYNATYMEALCNINSLCSNGQTCTSFSVFNINVVYPSPADDTEDIVVTFAHTNSLVVSVSIRYRRIDILGNYTSLAPILIGASPYTIQDLPEGQYEVSIRPNYSDGRVCPYVSLTTPACAAINAFSAVNGYNNETIDVVYSATTPQVKLVINYPNGGIFEEIFDNTGTFEWEVPANVYGTFSLILYPVCNEDTGFIGAGTAPVIVDIPFPPNGSILNNTSNNLEGVFLTTSIGGAYNFGTIPQSGGSAIFYLPAGFYATITVIWNGGTLGNATLVSGVNVYTGTVAANSVVYTNVTISGSILITLST